MVTEQPYTKTEFEVVQAAFIAGVENAAGLGTAVDKVVINAVAEKTLRRRLLLATEVDVDLFVQMESAAAPTELASSETLSLTRLNVALAAQNVSAT